MKEKKILILTSFLLCMGLLLPQNIRAAAKTHYIAVASDRHNTPEAISIAMKGMPDSVEYVCLNGDMVDWASSRSSSGSGTGIPPASPGSGRKQQAYQTSMILSEVQGVFPGLKASQVSIVYGSHDANATDDAGIMKTVDPSLLPSANGADTAEISQGRSGLIYTGYDGDKVAYYVYGVSYYDMMNPNDQAIPAENAENTTENVQVVSGNGNNSGTDSETKADEEASSEIPAGGMKSALAFEAFADAHPDVPLIVIGHVPIHAKRGDNLAASYWNKALNYAATGSENGSSVKRAVAYIHGHNHTVESDEFYTKPGQKLTVQGTAKGESAESDIYYSYVTAGYLRDNHTATLVTIEDQSLSFKKYKGCLVHFAATGESQIGDITIQQGNKLITPGIPVRSGYVFRGWFKDAACEQAWNFETDLVNEDMTLYAGWVKGAKPAVPTLTTKLLPASNQAVLSWAAIRGADDYRLAWRMAGESSWKRFWANGNTSYVMKGLKKKGLYEFKLAAAAESDDRYIYSEDAKSRYRYMSSLSGLKVKSNQAKRQARLSWKKDSKARGYQIQYGMDQTMKKASLIKLDPKKTTYTIKGLKKGKKYYIRIRPVAEKDKTVYYGAYSKCRTVKVK